MNGRWLTKLAIAIATLMATIALPAFAGDCGCAAPPQCCAQCNGGCVKVFHHHHCRKHCQSFCPQPERALTRELPPAGPVVETMPMRMMPMMAAPMMFAPVAAQRVAYVEEAPRAREITCESSSSRLALLESRFDQLHERVNTLQETIKTQTDILVEIKRKLDNPR
jgi:hypothetical protein